MTENIFNLDTLDKAIENIRTHAAKRKLTFNVPTQYFYFLGWQIKEAWPSKFLHLEDNRMYKSTNCKTWFGA